MKYLVGRVTKGGQLLVYPFVGTFLVAEMFIDASKELTVRSVRDFSCVLQYVATVCVGSGCREHIERGIHTSGLVPR